MPFSEKVLRYFDIIFGSSLIYIIAEGLLYKDFIDNVYKYPLVYSGLGTLEQAIIILGIIFIMNGIVCLYVYNKSKYIFYVLVIVFFVLFLYIKLSLHINVVGYNELFTDNEALWQNISYLSL